MLISKQPFYIRGLESVEECRDSAFGAMGVFIFTFTISVGYLIYESNHKPQPVVSAADEERMLPPGMSRYSVNAGEYELSESALGTGLLT